MAPRIPWRAAGSWPSRTGTVASRRTFLNLFNSEPKSKPLRVTLVDSRASSLSPFIFQLKAAPRNPELKQNILQNPDSHNAAVLLTTPERWMTQEFNQPQVLHELVQALTAGADIEEFTLLCAAVDYMPGSLGGLVPSSGISILRCNAEEFTPEFGGDPLPQTKQDEEKVGALAFEVGKACVTLPLARTTFNNGKPSTLVQHRFGMSKGSPRLINSVELKSKRIRLPPLPYAIESVADCVPLLPLCPITRPRLITESFGNIVRGIQVGNETVPASQELEAAINGMPRPRTPGPIGVWAMVTPETCPSYPQLEETQPPSSLPSKFEAGERDPLMSDLSMCYRKGGRVHKILSGGGGWGPKKGLLSLDPEQTHFSPPEEEDLLRFSKMMEGGAGFTSAGSRIQYFLSRPATKQWGNGIPDAYMFGVPGAYAPSGSSTPEVRSILVNSFGALSKQGIYLSGPSFPGSEDYTETKLSVPHARVVAPVQDPRTVVGGFVGDAMMLGGMGVVDGLLF